MTTNALKRIIFGRPLKSAEAEHEKMPVWKALPILSSDALSSVAYGTEQILVELAVVAAAAGTSVFFYSLPIALAIILLISILVISYRQVITTYPQGGGAYMVAKENLGMSFGRLTGISLLIDYTLTVAVSISAGVAAITSAFPSTVPWVVPIALVLCWFMVWMNLRGTSESGTAFAFPTYAFLFFLLCLVLKGIYDMATGNIHHTPHLLPPAVTPAGLTLFILLKAFSSGCSAVTGIEAISDAVPHFKTPSQKNARKTLTTLGILLAFIFGGVTLISQAYGVEPDPTGHTSVLSMIATEAFGRGFMYYAIQLTTMLILTLAANTSFNGFPILASIMAKDGNFPRMFANRGDRLSFHYGIVTLGVLASILLIVFKGKTDALIPLYAIGVFLSFTLAQSGLVLKWTRERGEKWVQKTIVNGLGAIVTLIVLAIFCVTKFLEGAWIVVALIPVLMFAITKVHSHYQSIARQLRYDPTIDTVSQKGNIIIVPIGGIHKVVAETIEYAKTLSPNVVAFYIGENKEQIEKVEAKWEAWDNGVRLVTFEARYRSVVQPLIEFVERVDKRKHHTDRITVLLPQFVTHKWWHAILHNQTAFRIRSRLIARNDVVVATVPYHLED